MRGSIIRALLAYTISTQDLISVLIQLLSAVPQALHKDDYFTTLAYLLNRIRNLNMRCREYGELLASRCEKASFKHSHSRSKGHAEKRWGRHPPHLNLPPNLPSSLPSSPSLTHLTILPIPTFMTARSFRKLRDGTGVADLGKNFTRTIWECKKDVSGDSSGNRGNVCWWRWEECRGPVYLPRGQTGWGKYRNGKEARTYHSSACAWTFWK